MTDFLANIDRAVIEHASQDPLLWIEALSTIRLREYQIGSLLGITESVLEDAGRNYVIIFPRQSGKNELQAQIEFYLLTVLNWPKMKTTRPSSSS